MTSGKRLTQGWPRGGWCSCSTLSARLTSAGEEAPSLTSAARLPGWNGHPSLRISMASQQARRQSLLSNLPLCLLGMCYKRTSSHSFKGVCVCGTGRTSKIQTQSDDEPN